MTPTQDKNCVALLKLHVQCVLHYLISPPATHLPTSSPTELHVSTTTWLLYVITFPPFPHLSTHRQTILHAKSLSIDNLYLLIPCLSTTCTSSNFHNLFFPFIQYDLFTYSLLVHSYFTLLYNLLHVPVSYLLDTHLSLFLHYKYQQPRYGFPWLLVSPSPIYL